MSFASRKRMGHLPARQTCRRPMAFCIRVGQAARNDLIDAVKEGEYQKQSFAGTAVRLQRAIQLRLQPAAVLVLNRWGMQIEVPPRSCGCQVIHGRRDSSVRWHDVSLPAY